LADAKAARSIVLSVGQEQFYNIFLGIGIAEQVLGERIPASVEGIVLVSCWLPCCLLYFYAQVLL